MKASSSSNRALLCALGIGLACAAKAQDGGPAYKPSKYPGVNVRSVPGPQAAPQSRAVRPSAGITLTNNRRVRLRNGSIVEVSDIDPASFPRQTATVTSSGRLSVRCLDPAHKYLGQAAHAAKHARLRGNSIRKIAPVKRSSGNTSRKKTR